MKSTTLIVTSMVISAIATSAVAASLPPTPANIKQATATPGNPIHFLGNGLIEPSGAGATTPGDVVNYIDPKTGTWYQYGTSLSPLDTYLSLTAGGA